MGFLDELKRLTHPYEDEMEDDYDEDEDVYEDEDEPEERNQTPPPREREEPRRREYQEPPRRNNGGKVVNIHATTQLQVVLVKPDRYENASEIADHLRKPRRMSLAACWTFCPAWPMPRRGRSRRSPCRLTSSRPTTWTSWVTSSTN